MAPQTGVRRSALRVVVTCPDGGRAPRGLGAWLANAAPATARGEVTLAVVSDGRMQTLNRTFRGKDYATDVLSFPVADASPRGAKKSAKTIPREAAGYLGDIVIAAGVAARQADEAGHPLATELKILALHGLLHLLGYDHERDEGRMERAERRLRRAARLKEGLIERGARPPRRSR